jgi:glycine/D-amino acid oxidase-like deaminating enzyme
MRVLNPAPEARALRAIDREFRRLFPQFETLPLNASWAGMIDAMPDVVPVVDRAVAIPGLVIATGMSGHGFGIGPGMGRVLSDLIQGNETGHNLHRFRLSRFSDGSPIQLGPSL